MIMSPLNHHANGKPATSQAKVTDKAKATEDAKTSGRLSHASHETDGSQQGERIPPKATSFTMHRWLQETKNDQPWSAISRRSEEVSNVARASVNQNDKGQNE